MSNPEQFDELLDSMPGRFATRGKRSPDGGLHLIEEVLPLTAEHVELARTHINSGVPLGINNGDLKRVRNTHHRLAQLLAMGMDENRAGVLCNYQPQRVSQLKNDPAFAELMRHYETTRDHEFADFVSAAKELSLDFLGKLQEDLDESPEKFTPQLTMDAIKLLADRTGHAPVSKTVNLNVNLDMADRLKAARERLAAARNGSDGDR